MGELQGVQAQTYALWYIDLVAHVSCATRSMGIGAGLQYLWVLAPTHPCMTLGAVALGR